MVGSSAALMLTSESGPRDDLVDPRGRVEPAKRSGQSVVVGEDDDLSGLGDLREQRHQAVDLGGIHRLHRVVEDDEPERRLVKRGAGQEQGEREGVQLALAHNRAGRCRRPSPSIGGGDRDPAAVSPGPSSRRSPRSTLLSCRSKAQACFAISEIGAMRSFFSRVSFSFSHFSAAVSRSTAGFFANQSSHASHQAEIRAASGPQASSRSASAAVAAARTSATTAARSLGVQLEVVRQIQIALGRSIEGVPRAARARGTRAVQLRRWAHRSIGAGRRCASARSAWRARPAPPGVRQLLQLGLLALRPGRGSLGPGVVEVSLVAHRAGLLAVLGVELQRLAADFEPGDPAGGLGLTGLGHRADRCSQPVAAVGTWLGVGRLQLGQRPQRGDDALVGQGDAGGELADRGGVRRGLLQQGATAWARSSASAAAAACSALRGRPSPPSAALRVRASRVFIRASASASCSVPSTLAMRVVELARTGLEQPAELVVGEHRPVGLQGWSPAEDGRRLPSDPLVPCTVRCAVVTCSSTSVAAAAHRVLQRGSGRSLFDDLGGDLGDARVVEVAPAFGPLRRLLVLPAVGAAGEQPFPGPRRCWTCRSRCDRRRLSGPVPARASRVTAAPMPRNPATWTERRKAPLAGVGRLGRVSLLAASRRGATLEVIVELVLTLERGEDEEPDRVVEGRVRLRCAPRSSVMRSSVSVGTLEASGVDCGSGELVGQLHRRGVDTTAGEGREDALVCLTGQCPGSWLTERRAGSGGGAVQEVVQSGTGKHQQPVSRPGAGHGETAEGGVEVVELVGARKRVDGDRDPVRLPLPRVNRRCLEHPIRQLKVVG